MVNPARWVSWQALVSAKRNENDSQVSGPHCQQGFWFYWWFNGAAQLLCSRQEVETFGAV
jgi:hypothetical protein